jgi:hypothetical protein
MSLTDITSKLKQNKLSSKQGFLEPKKSCDKLSNNSDKIFDNNVIKKHTITNKSTKQMNPGIYCFYYLNFHQKVRNLPLFR